MPIDISQKSALCLRAAYIATHMPHLYSYAWYNVADSIALCRRYCVNMSPMLYHVRTFAFVCPFRHRAACVICQTTFLMHFPLEWHGKVEVLNALISYNETGRRFPVEAVRFLHLCGICVWRFCDGSTHPSSLWPELMAVAKAREKRSNKI